MAILSRRRSLLTYLLAAVFLILASIYVATHGERFFKFLSISPRWFPAQCMAVVGSLALQAWFLKQLTRELKAAISPRECFCLVGASSLFEAFTLPAAGAVYRGFQLNKVWGVPVLAYMAGLTVFSLVRLLVWGLIASVGLAGLAVEEEHFFRLGVPLLFVSLIAVVLLLLSQQILRPLAEWRKSQFSALAKPGLLVTSSGWIKLSAVISMLGMALIQLLTFYVVFRSSGLPIDFPNSTVITSFHQLGGIWGLTPGGLGIQELMGVLHLKALGVDVSDTLMVLGMMRAGRFFVILAVGGLCWWLSPKSRALNLEIEIVRLSKSTSQRQTQFCRGSHACVDPPELQTSATTALRTGTQSSAISSAKAIKSV